ncbi:MAG: 50S ribosomal protein L44e [Candidatus Micrarchaeota archaeon]
MNVPKKINTYCPKCRKHTEHTVKKIKMQKSPAKARALSVGQRRHERKARGYTSKVGAKANVVKQTKKSVLMLECGVCKKKQQRPIANLRKPVEIKKD